MRVSTRTGPDEVLLGACVVSGQADHLLKETIHRKSCSFLPQALRSVYPVSTTHLLWVSYSHYHHQHRTNSTDTPSLTWGESGTEKCSQQQTLPCRTEESFPLLPASKEGSSGLCALLPLNGFHQSKRKHSCKSEKQFLRHSYCGSFSVKLLKGRFGDGLV